MDVLWRAGRALGWCAALACFAVIAALPSRAEAAPACPTTCDAACGACCSVWSIRATCGDGESLVERGFATWAKADEAARAADAASTRCNPSGASCPRALRCAAAPGAKWEAYCAEGDAVPPPQPLDGAPLDALLGVLGGDATSLDEASALSRRPYERAESEAPPDKSKSGSGSSSRTPSRRPSPERAVALSAPVHR